MESHVQIYTCGIQGYLQALRLQGRRTCGSLGGKAPDGSLKMIRHVKIVGPCKMNRTVKKLKVVAIDSEIRFYVVTDVGKVHHVNFDGVCDNNKPANNI